VKGCAARRMESERPLEIAARSDLLLNDCVVPSSGRPLGMNHKRSTADGALGRQSGRRRQRSFLSTRFMGVCQPGHLSISSAIASALNLAASLIHHVRRRDSPPAQSNLPEYVTASFVCNLPGWRASFNIPDRLIRQSGASLLSDSRGAAANISQRTVRKNLDLTSCVLWSI
jgi:hypothetical protein